MKGYRTSFTTTAGMLTVVVEREANGDPVARFSWVPGDTDGALGELAAALTAMSALPERRQQCRAAAAGRRRAPRPRQLTSGAALLDDLDHAIELLELRAVAP